MSRTSRNSSAPLPEPTFTQDDILEALRQACNDVPPDEGPGLTAKEIRQRKGWTETTVDRVLERALAQGRLRTRKVYRLTRTGVRAPITAYWVE